MLKPALGLAAAGILGVVLWKLLGLLLLPLVGVAFAMLLTVMKVILIVGLVCLVAWLIRRTGSREAGAA
jgi:nitrate/nitrite transporter NarK